MQDVPFDRVVPILTGRYRSVMRGIATTAEACDHLLNLWPAGKEGAKHYAARVACKMVLEGKRRPAHARKAFAEAAEEAGILIAADRFGPPAAPSRSGSARAMP